MEYMSIGGPTEFYFGYDYGSARSALRKCDAEHVMVSYLSPNKTPWDIDSRWAKSYEPSFFIDSGAYSLFSNGESYETSAREYIEYVADAREKVSDGASVRFTLRDVTCDPESLAQTGHTVRDHQIQTIEYHKDCLDAMDDVGLSRSEVEPYTVLQGSTPDEYVEHLDMHIEAGTLTQNVGIGSLVGRSIEEIEEIVGEVFVALDTSYVQHLHGYGVKPDHLQSEQLRLNLDSADSAEWSYCQYDRIHGHERAMHVMMKEYITTKRRLHALFAGDHLEMDPDIEDDIDFEMVESILEDDDLSTVAPTQEVTA